MWNIRRYAVGGLYIVMKRLILSLVALVSMSAFACTNVIVGKKASADGSVFVSYSADSYGMYGNIYHHNGGTHAAGEMRKVYDWDSNKYHGEIPQAVRTYTVNGQMNENQVSITETTFGGREELWKTEGLIDYGSLIYIGLERATSARDAINIMTSLVDKYGYCSEGESFSICDKNEAWIMEMIGKGSGYKGAVWVAVRIPDDCVSAHANQSRITKFSQYAKEDVLYSKDVIKFARQKGYFNGKDKDFSFRDAYSPNDFGAVRYCDARAWSIFNRLCDGMDKYVEYAKGNDLAGEMPLFMKPKKPVTLWDVMACMRDHYEGTPFDIQHELGAGPYNMPYRPTPLSYEIDGKEYFNERPISTQQTSFCFVGQMRSEYPDFVGGIAWITNDDPNMAPFVPLYCSITEMPKCFQRIDGVQDDATFSWESAFWLQNTVSNMVYPYYDKMFPDLLRSRNIDQLVFMKEEPDNTRKILATNQSNGKDEAVALATKTSQDHSDYMMRCWNDMLKYLIVKHNDMAIKKVDSLDHFKKTEHGYVESPHRPGYPVRYRQAIVKESGDKYLMK